MEIGDKVKTNDGLMGVVIGGTKNYFDVRFQFDTYSDVFRFSRQTFQQFNAKNRTCEYLPE